MKKEHMHTFSGETNKHSNKSIEELMRSNLEATNKLISKIDKLVSLFDEAAKHVSEVETTEAKVNALAGKLESLLDQNKAIAQGLLLLEKYVRGKTRLEGVPQPAQTYQ